MAIFRCNACGHLREVSNEYTGKTVKCPRCTNATRIYDTKAFISALIQKNIDQGKEIRTLRGNKEQKNNASENPTEFSLGGIDINNTDLFSRPANYSPIIQWFNQRNIQIEINPDSVNTTGFFDEIAILLGEDFDTLKVVSNKIKHIQNKGYDNVKIDATKKTKEEIEKLTHFCKTLYDYSFVAKYFFQKKEKVIRLTLQTAPRIREFFNGIWMEWFTLMKILELFQKIDKVPSLSRNSKITFQNGNSNELDIFFLITEDTPVYIECKSGEFRHDIKKYISLRNKLGIDKDQFIICVFGLSKEQAQGMTSMYNMTFLNEKMLTNHLEILMQTA